MFSREEIDRIFFLQLHSILAIQCYYIIVPFFSFPFFPLTLVSTKRGGTGQAANRLCCCEDGLDKTPRQTNTSRGLFENFVEQVKGNRILGKEQKKGSDWSLLEASGLVLLAFSCLPPWTESKRPMKLFMGKNVRRLFYRLIQATFLPGLTTPCVLYARHGGQSRDQLAD